MESCSDILRELAALLEYLADYIRFFLLTQGG